MKKFIKRTLRKPLVLDRVNIMKLLSLQVSYKKRVLGIKHCIHAYEIFSAQPFIYSLFICLS